MGTLIRIGEILEKKMKWATLEEDKVRDFKSFISDVRLQAYRNKPDHPMKDEEDVLVQILCELNEELDDLRNECSIPRKAIFSLLEEIYKMSGGVYDLTKLLESEHTLTCDYKEWIMERWDVQRKLGCREFKSSEPLDVKKSMEFLQKKADEIDLETMKMMDILPRSEKVQEFLELANNAFSWITRWSD